MTEELTTDTFFLRLYEAGVGREEILESELRHLFLRHRAYEQRTRRQEIHLIGLRNEIRSALGSNELIEHPYGTSSTSQDTGKDEAARHAMLRQMDLDGTEEVAPEDVSQLTQ